MLLGLFLEKLHPTPEVLKLIPVWPTRFSNHWGSCGTSGRSRIRRAKLCASTNWTGTNHSYGRC